MIQASNISNSIRFFYIYEKWSTIHYKFRNKSEIWKTKNKLKNQTQNYLLSNSIVGVWVCVAPNKNNNLYDFRIKIR